MELPFSFLILYLELIFWRVYRIWSEKKFHVPESVELHIFTGELSTKFAQFTVADKSNFIYQLMYKGVHEDHYADQPWP